MLGVVPTGEVPYWMEPPWLPSGRVWVGVADHLEWGVAVDGRACS